LFRIFSEPKAKPVALKSKEEIKKRYTVLRNLIFLTCYLMYVVSYICRRSLSMSAPVAFEFGKEDMGIVMGIGAFVYGIGKFVNGILADKGNVRTSLALNTIMAGAFTGLMTFPIFLSPFDGKNHDFSVCFACIIWGISNWLHSGIFPYCAKSLIRWIPNKSRAKWWGIFSSSHELGAFIGTNTAFPVGVFVQRSLGFGGAESIFVFPFLISISVGVIGFFSLKDRPVSVGLPDVEEICGSNLSGGVEKKYEASEENLTYFQTLKKYVVKSKVIWNLAAIYFFVYIFRECLNNRIFEIIISKDVGRNADFTHIIQNQDSVYFSAFSSSVLFLLGFLGTILAPAISEKIFKGKRAPANFWCLIASALSLIGVWLSISKFSPISSNEVFQKPLLVACLCIAGFSICVPQVLVGGVCAVEFSSKKVGAAAVGLIGFVGYIGTTVGHPISGWLMDFSKEFFGDQSRLALIFWGCAALFGAICCVPLWNYDVIKK
jgi:OPA family sugar phosphate sensor protein UhpC-like MFS transporter